MWHRPLLHISYLPIQVLKTSLRLNENCGIESKLLFAVTILAQKCQNELKSDFVKNKLGTSSRIQFLRWQYRW